MSTLAAMTRRPRPAPTVQLSFKLPPELLDQLDERAHALRMNRSDLVRQMLADALGVDVETPAPQLDLEAAS